MNYILFDDNTRNNLLPLTFTRPVADIRFGIITIREKWERYLNTTTSSLTEEYLNAKFPLYKSKENVLINGSICPSKELVIEIDALKTNQALVDGETVIAYKIISDDIEAFLSESIDNMEMVESKTSYLQIAQLYDIFHKNDVAIMHDFELLTMGRQSESIDKSVCVIGNPNKVFIEKGAIVQNVSLNTTNGPIYIGTDAEIMEGSAIRGPFALCDQAVIKMGAKIYGATTIGPHSKIGGEVNNSVIIGHTNKAHDGFLGQSVLGEWCNLGADTNNSNLKNNYENVKLWNYAEKRFIDTGLQFCGLIMGDHSKTGINTMFNTGTVVGVFCNIYGSGFQRNFIGSFSWGGVSGFSEYEINKALATAERVYARRNIDFNQTEKDILTSIYDKTFEFRRLV